MRLLAALVVALALAGTAQAGTIRVAVASLGDPEVAWNLERHALPDLCRSARRTGARTWRLTCPDPRPLAAALGLPATVRGHTLVVRTPFPWRRFPLYLRHLAVGGTKRFRAVSAGPRRIVATRPGLTLEFVRMEPHAAAAAFARGEVDVAPVPAGDLRAALDDAALRGKVRVRPLDAVDAVVLPGGLSPLLRRTYWSTANRADYVLVASDGVAQPAFGFLRGSPQPPATSYRGAKGRIRELEQPRVGVAGDPELASIVVADWRDLGLGAAVAPAGAARFERIAALYPGPEGLFLALERRCQARAWHRAMSDSAVAGCLAPEVLRAALAAVDPAPALGRLDARLRARAQVVPLAWAVGAQLVSPRLRGWRQDALGLVDYTRVRG